MFILCSRCPDAINVYLCVIDIPWVSACFLKFEFSQQGHLLVPLSLPPPPRLLSRSLNQVRCFHDDSWPICVVSCTWLSSKCCLGPPPISRRLFVNFRPENESAFCQEFIGKQSCEFFEAYLGRIHDLWKSDEYYCYASVLQSSGWGKSRLMFQVSEQYKIPLLYFCLRKVRFVIADFCPP